VPKAAHHPPHHLTVPPAVERVDGAAGQNNQGGITRFGTENDRRMWDAWLPYLVMGYRMSNHAALGGYFPYFLMHGRQPMSTGQAARQLLRKPIDFNSPEQWVKACKQQA
jgi:hypothetical protein